METLLIAVCALLFFIVGAVLLYKNSKFVKSAVKTTGEIVEINQHANTSGRRTTMYSTVIEFKTFNNTAIRFVNPSSSSIKPKMGKLVDVYYYEENPEKAKVGSVFNLYILPSILVVLGLFLLFALFKTA